MRRLSVCLTAFVLVSCSADPDPVRPGGSGPTPGPGVVATSGPPGGEIEDLAAAPNGSLFAATSNGVFRSVDDGRSWDPASHGIPRMPTDSAPAHTYSVWAGADGAAVAGTELGVYWSDDGGDSWSTSDLVGELEPRDLVAASGGVLFVATGTGEFQRSEDAGRTWVVENRFRVWADQLASDSKGVLYALDQGTPRIARSPDAAASWTELPPLPLAAVPVTLEVGPGDEMYVGVEAAEGLHPFIYRLNEAGDGWIGLALNANGPHQAEAVAVAADGTIYVGWSSLAPAGSPTYVARSVNAGISWETFQLGFTESDDLRFLDISPQGTVFGGTGQGLFENRNPVEGWVLSPLQASHVTALLCTNNDALLAATFRGPGKGNLFRSVDLGASWQKFDDDLDEALLNGMIQLPDGRIVAASEDGICHSDDAGQTWSWSGAIPTRRMYRVNWAGVDGEELIAMQVNPVWGSIMVASHDRGESWFRWVDIAITPLVSDGTYVFGGRSESLMRNRGAGWFPFDLSAHILSLAFAPSGDLLIGTNEGMFRSLDRGTSATQSGLADRYVKQLLVTSASKCLAATLSGLYVSIDDGLTWNSVSPELDQDAVDDMVVTSEGEVFVVVAGRGVMRYEP